MEWNPNEDGITHYNIYSKSNSRIGKFLTHFIRTPFQHPTLGNFESMEGFWYFIKTGCKDDYLRSLYGYAAKEYGKKLPVVKNSEFDQLIAEASRIKMETYPEMKEAIKLSSLPFTHYYVYGNFTFEKGKRVWAENVKIRESHGGHLLIGIWEALRTELHME